MAMKGNDEWISPTEEEFNAAMKSDFCKPKVYSSIPNTKNIEPRKDSRVVGKDDLKAVKECSKCQKKIKKVKKAFVCNCKENLFCCYDCKQGSQHKCHDRVTWGMPLNDFADMGINAVYTWHTTR